MPRTKASRKAYRLAAARKKKLLELQNNPPKSDKDQRDEEREEEDYDEMREQREAFGNGDADNWEGEEHAEPDNESFDSDADMFGEVLVPDRVTRMEQLIRANKHATDDKLLRGTMLEGMNVLTVMAKNLTTDSESIRHALAQFRQKRLLAKLNDDKGPKKLRKTGYDFCESVELMMESVMDSFAQNTPNEMPEIGENIKTEERDGEQSIESMALIEMPEIKDEDQSDYVEMTEQVKVEPEDFPSTSTAHTGTNNRKRTISQSLEAHASWSAPNVFVPAETYAQPQPQAARRPNILKKSLSQKKPESSGVIIVAHPPPTSFTFSSNQIALFPQQPHSAMNNPTETPNFASTSKPIKDEPGYEDNSYYPDEAQATIKTEPGTDDGTEFPTECLFSSGDNIKMEESILDDHIDAPYDDYHLPPGPSHSIWERDTYSPRRPSPYARPPLPPRPTAAKRSFLPFSTMRQQGDYHAASSKHPELQAVANQTKQIMEDLRKEQLEKMLKSRDNIAEELRRLKQQVTARPAAATLHKKGGPTRVIMMPSSYRVQSVAQLKLKNAEDAAREAREAAMRKIEMEQREMMSITCRSCGQVFSTQNALSLHESSFHPMIKRQLAPSTSVLDQPGTSRPYGRSGEGSD